MQESDTPLPSSRLGLFYAYVGQLTGTTLHSVSRVLSAWEQKGQGNSLPIQAEFESPSYLRDTAACPCMSRTCFADGQSYQANAVSFGFRPRRVKRHSRRVCRWRGRGGGHVERPRLGRAFGASRPVGSSPQGRDDALCMHPSAYWPVRALADVKDRSLWRSPPERLNCAEQCADDR